MTGKDLIYMLQGWGNLVIPSEATTEESKRRFQICNPCEFRKGTLCGECGCVLVAKTRSESKCPKNKW